VWRCTRYEHSTASLCVHHTATDFNAQSALKHVPSLVVAAMKVPGSDQPRLFGQTALIPPLGYDESSPGEPIT
jgi:hypothetical protein